MIFINLDLKWHVIVSILFMHIYKHPKNKIELYKNSFESLHVVHDFLWSPQSQIWQVIKETTATYMYNVFLNKLIYYAH